MNTGKKKEKDKTDRRSFVVQMEEEEHVLNMQILKRRLDYEDLKVKKMNRELELTEKESALKVRLLEAQISSTAPREFIFSARQNEEGLLDS